MILTHFTQKNHRDDKHMERYSTTLVFREMQIKNTMKYHHTPIRKAKIKPTIPSVCKDGAKLELACTAAENVK